MRAACVRRLRSFEDDDEDDDDDRIVHRLTMMRGGRIKASF